MSIYKMTGESVEKLLRTQQQTQNLRAGQIIQGKILKLFPNQKAQIQLGTQQMIAQLEAPLSLDHRYHFQVKSTDQMVHLKVLGEQIASQANQSTASLMMGLGVKPTKQSLPFVQNLINENIPFDKGQLKQAMQILDGAKNGQQAKQVLTEMFARKLPMTPQVFDALVAKQANGIGTQLTKMNQQLQNQPMTPLKDAVERLTMPPQQGGNIAFAKQAIADMNASRPMLFQSMQATGMVSQSMTEGLWNAQWKQVEGQLDKAGNSLQLPVTIRNNNPAQLLQQMEQLLQQKSSLQQATEAMLPKTQTNTAQQANIANQTDNGRMQALIQNIMNNPQSLSDADFAFLKSQLTTKLLPLLPENMQTQIRQLQNQPADLAAMTRLVESLADSETYVPLEKVSRNVQHDRIFQLAPPREQFMQQIQLVRDMLGIGGSSQLFVNETQEQTIKTMLLQMMTGADGTAREQATQTINFINGMHINSVQESASFIQAAISMPGEKLGLNNDIDMEFESRKTEDGKIDSDYCRILFYLDLKGMEKTIIDMNVQKRSIGITVYNEMDHLKQLSKPFQAKLSEGLETLDYHLSSITFKPIQQENKPKNIQPKMENTYHGVDYRI